MSELGNCKHEKPRPPSGDVCPCCVRAWREIFRTIETSSTNTIDIYTTASKSPGTTKTVEVIGLFQEDLVEVDSSGAGQGPSFISLCEITGISSNGEDSPVAEVPIPEITGDCDCCEEAWRLKMIQLEMEERTFDIVTTTGDNDANPEDVTIPAVTDVGTGVVRVQKNNQYFITAYCHLARIDDVT